MDPSVLPIQHLLSLPAMMARRFADLEGRPLPGWFAGHDPVGAPLGSGGGTAHLLAEAWRATAPEKSFPEWLRESRKLLLHAGGQSRRLPAYAATGKVLMPFPVFRWGRGQRLEQSLLDVQLPDYRRILEHAPSGYVALLASGDVLLRFSSNLPAFPEVDVLGLGMWTNPRQAREFGVFFLPRGRANEFAFFLQKPSAEKIRALSEDHQILVDTGMWLLSERAVAVLMERCGWDGAAARFRDGSPTAYEFYAEFALGLGTQPSRPDATTAGLTSAVVGLPEPEFHHFGTSRQMIESVAVLQNRESDPARAGGPAGPWHPDQFVQNARLDFGVHREENSTLWVENSVIPDSWILSQEHVLTGIPENTWKVRLERGACLDFVPVGEQGWCLRFYGMDDPFRGPVGAESTHLLGSSVTQWMARRGLPLEAVGGGDASQDVQQAALFPVVDLEAIDGAFLEWLIRAEPEGSDSFRRLWIDSRRLSAREAQSAVNLDRLIGQRTALRQEALGAMLRHRRWSVFHRLDLERTAALYAATGKPLPPETEGDRSEALDLVHEAMFRAAVLRHRGDAGAAEAEAEGHAFQVLRDVLIREAQLNPVRPRARVVEDQIVWARSPVRFDLAGGWTDTPPYCLEHGGQVVNVAVDLNGQPPMQVFVRLSSRPEIVLRSIDQGLEDRVRTYEELDTFATPSGAFSLVKAACALAGFLPRFHTDGGRSTLAEMLRAFGGGLEISVLSAVPKGSGLGTSSILAATVLAALGEVCGLDWDREELFRRTLVLEQMITTGGGWQDQAGGIFGGVKLIETGPGLTQDPKVRWLPDTLFGPGNANRRILLYYTGITRLAKGILAEIVRGIFLNSPEHLRTLGEIAASAHSTTLALERCDYAGLAAAIRTTWRLKQKLDRGTNPPEVRDILVAVADDLLAAKLPGAGGGGFLLLFARDEDSALRIRRRLTDHPPNGRARFVDFGVSAPGLQVSRS
ncbi:MAG: bifunctional fucokinase/fucose-1-phosphate guanylyltransferase [Limisphaerales bacterium]